MTGIVGLPGHLTGYRERDVLRHFRASSLSIWRIFGTGFSQSGNRRYWRHHDSDCRGFRFSREPAAKSVARHPGFFGQCNRFHFTGIAAGSSPAHIPGDRGCRACTLFVMLILGGAGPPPEAMTHLMRVVGDFTPMQHAVTLLQNAWGPRLGLDGIRDYGRDTNRPFDHRRFGDPAQLLNKVDHLIA